MNVATLAAEAADYLEEMTHEIGYDWTEGVWGSVPAVEFIPPTLAAWAGEFLRGEIVTECYADCDGESVSQRVQTTLVVDGEPFDDSPLSAVQAW